MFTSSSSVDKTKLNNIECCMTGYLRGFHFFRSQDNSNGFLFIPSSGLMSFNMLCTYFTGFKDIHNISRVTFIVISRGVENV